MSEITNDAGNVEWIIGFATLVEEYSGTAFTVKRAFLRGEPGVAIGAFATAPANVPPSPLVAGVEKRSRERDQRFKRSVTMTEAALSALDLVDSQAPTNPTSVQPEIHVSAAQTGGMFAIVVSKRGESTLWEVQIRRKDGDWESAGRYNSKSADMTVALTTPGQPMQIDVRVLLLKDNAPYGQLSMFMTVTINP